MGFVRFHRVAVRVVVVVRVVAIVARGQQQVGLHARAQVVDFVVVDALLPRAAVLHWGAHPLNAALLLALLVMLLHHMQLGLSVVIEDYVHVPGSRLMAILAMKAITALLLFASVISVVRLAVSF